MSDEQQSPNNLINQLAKRMAMPSESPDEEPTRPATRSRRALMPPNPLPAALVEVERDLTEHRQCPRCQVVQARLWYHTRGKRIGGWEDCQCADPAEARQAFLATLEHNQRAQQRARWYRTSGLASVEHLAVWPLNLELLTGDPTPYPTAMGWLHRALQSATCRERVSWVLLLYSPIRGNGKTTLAARLAHRAHELGKSVMFVPEADFVDRLWGGTLSEKQSQMHELATCHLLVIDDLGQRAPKGDGLAAEYFDLIDRRYQLGGWMIITSNYTLDELLARNTINESTHSRLHQMVDVIEFTGNDRRQA